MDNNDYNINAKELLAVIVALRLWGSQLAGSRILIRSNNATTVQAISNRHSHSALIQQCLCIIWLLCAVSDLDLMAEYIPGYLNTIADLLSRWSQDPLDPLFWTAALVAFFTFFRKSNLFISSATAFDPARNLTRNDVQILQSFALITVNWTKTNQNKERLLSIPIPCIPNSPLCPVSALEHYFLQIPVSLSQCLPLFTFVHGNQLHPLTYSHFVKLLRRKLSSLGLQPELYSSHSFRRGGASFAFALHLPGELIQLQGDWKSDAYLHYLDKPLTQRLKVAFAFHNALSRT